MKRSSIINLLVLSTAFFMMSGCGKKNDAAENQAQAASDAAKAVSQAMGGSSATAHKPAAHAVPSTTLSGLLPNVGGYTAHEPSTSSANLNGIEWSVAEREFDNGEKHIKV